MGFTVTVLPSGHTFTAEPQETLLEAALRSGLNLYYNCSSGSCGGCKARLLKGELGKPDFFDFRLSQQEKAQDIFLLCRNHAASDLVIDAAEAGTAQDIPWQSLSTRVNKLERAGDNTLIMQLRTPRSNTLRFLAGQHVQLRLENGIEKDLAIASCPCNGMILHFHLHYTKGDPFIEYAFNEIKTGNTVEVEGPFGTFILDEEAGRPIIMIGENEWFASLKSLIEHAINIDIQQPIRFYWLATEQVGHYYENYCRSWTQVLDDYSYTPLLLSNPERDDTEWTQIAEKIVEQLEPLDGYDLYLSATPQLEESFARVFRSYGLDESRVFQASMRKEGRGASVKK